MVGNTQVGYIICLNTLNEDNLTRHEKTIHNPLVTGTIEYHSKVDDVAFNRYKCRDCTYSTKRSIDLRRHEKDIHKPSVKNMYKCQDCSYSTHWSSNLRKHERAIHNPSFKHMYECRDCTYSIYWPSNLRRHEKFVHNPLVTEKIEYNSTIDVAALKNEIVQCDNEYQTKIEFGREIKKIVQELNVNIASLDKEKIDALELFENHEQVKEIKHCKYLYV